ncbi:MAG: class I SAM-dependent methyltransferase [Deltaproteobacteria bacterium]|nr:class I SAM-dependent methyltransferase [Deltaproteobacteria bacterium]
MNTPDLGQINQLMTDMYHAFMSLPLEAQEYFLQTTHDAMSNKNNTSIYTLLTFKTFYRLAIKHGAKVENGSILEIGAGKPLGTGIFWNFAGANRYTSIDKFTEINIDDNWIDRFKSLLEFNIFNPYRMSFESLITVTNTHCTIDEERLRFIHADLNQHEWKDDKFDFIYSNAVLEHMTNLPLAFKNMYNILEDNGVMFHSIDLREHASDRPIADKNTSIEFYKFSIDEWNHRYPPGSDSYINRLRVSDYRSLFKNAGFSIISEDITQTMPLTSEVYKEIHPDFHHYSLPDLQATGVQFVLRKPVENSNN